MTCLWTLEYIARIHIFSPCAQTLSTVELSFHSMSLSIRSWSPMFSYWLLCIHYQFFPLVVHLEAVFKFEWRATSWGSLSEIKLILACQEVLKRVWHSVNRKEVALHLNLHTTFKHAPKTYWTWKVLYAKQPTPNEKSMLSQRRTLLTVSIALAISAI